MLHITTSTLESSCLMQLETNLMRYERQLNCEAVVELGGWRNVVPIKIVDSQVYESFLMTEAQFPGGKCQKK